MINTGKGLERFMYGLYSDLGYQDVKLDYRIKKSNGEESARGQIDLTYKHLFIRRYVECKQRTNANVTFDDYAKFETTLKTFNIPTFLGEMVTNKYFDSKVKLRAKETRIKLIDRDELIKLNKSRISLPRVIFLSYNFFETAEKKGFIDALDYFSTRFLDIDTQIRRLEQVS